MADDCFAGFALFPIIMIFVFISILARALRAGARSGGYSSYGGRHQYRYYGNSFYALQYLAQQPAYRPYQAPSYPNHSPPYQPPASYRTPPQYNPYQPGAPSYSSAGYGQAYSSAPPPAYTQAPSPGYQSVAPPAAEVPKVSCSYCGSLNPKSEHNCLLCGAPIK